MSEAYRIALIKNMAAFKHPYCAFLTGISRANGNANPAGFGVRNQGLTGWGWATTSKKARKRDELNDNRELDNDCLHNVQQGQNQVQQLDRQLDEQPAESTPAPCRRAPQRCSGCGIVGPTIRNCPIE
jgi:hypothetical protein